MKNHHLIPLLAVVVITVLFAAGCKDKVNSISSILQQPEKFMHKDVTVAGVVTKTYAIDLFITEAGAYQIDDGSGKIWVITKTGVPREGAEVGLRGNVDGGVKLGREVFGAVIRETERRTR